MTPRKCDEHELRPGEYADSPRYERALIESRSCWKCKARAIVAQAAYRWKRFWGLDEL